VNWQMRLTLSIVSNAKQGRSVWMPGLLIHTSHFECDNTCEIVPQQVNALNLLGTEPTVSLGLWYRAHR